MGRLSELSARFGGDRRGSILPVVGVSIAAMISAAALAADYGSLFVAKQRLQSAADLAAVAAAATGGEEAVARRVLGENGIAAETVVVTRGRYAAATTRPPGTRFQPGGAAPNAARVVVTASTPLFLSRLMYKRATLTLRAEAIAEQADHASFGVGSRLAALQGGIANATLGALFGVRLSLSLLDYRALLDTQIDLFTLGDCLARSLGLAAATYRETMAGTIGPSSFGAALTEAARTDGAGLDAMGALRALTGSLAGATTAIELSGLVDFGEIGGAVAATGARGPEIRVNAFDLVAAAARLAGGGREFRIDFGAQTGVAGLVATVATGERAQTGSWVTVAGQGATVRTAQTRLLLDARIAAPPLATLAVPIFLQAASASATLTDLRCPRAGWNRPGATLAVGTGLLDLAVASVSASAVALANPSPFTGIPATLLSVPLVSVTGAARLTLGSQADTLLNFDDADIATGRVKTVSSSRLAGSAVASLLSSLTVRVVVAGLSLGLDAQSVQAIVGAAIAGAATSLDAVTDALLRSLGIGLGQADAWINGLSCRRAVLVQ